MYRRSGFTLIELLIVIGLIVLLGGVALAAVTYAGNQPSNAMCLQNQSSIWKGMMLYVSDNYGRMPKVVSQYDSNGRLYDPYGAWPGEHPAYRLPWSNVICRYPASMLQDSVDPPVPAPWSSYNIRQADASYVEEPDVFMCPEADRAADFAMWPEQYYGQNCTDWWYNVQGTYGLNSRMNTRDFPNRWEVAQPSETYMFADSWLFAFDHINESDNWYSLRHGANREMLNIMFHDGHSESMTEPEIVTAEDSFPFGVGTPWWGGTWD